uniref:Spectrin repeat containing nuclear envelope protein 2 n=1 Tax=Pseudonaja textilis TaxID=8673 RepID=A0A670ZE95_PSETE
QKRTFTSWVNSQLEKHPSPSLILDLYSDIGKGHVLLDLLEVLSGQQLSREKGSNTFQRRSNIENALTFLKNRSLKLINIHVADIIEGKPSIVLGLIWIIILHFHIEELAKALSCGYSHSSLDSPSTGDLSPAMSPTARTNVKAKERWKISAKKAVLLWAKEQCDKHGSINVADFKSSWRNGLAFLAIIHALRPGLVDVEKAKERSNKENLREAFQVAEKELGIPRLLEPEDVDVISPDEKSIMTYVAQFLQYFKSLPVAEDRMQVQYVTSKALEHVLYFFCILFFSNFFYDCFFAMLSFTEAFNEEKKRFLPILESKRKGSDLNEDYLEMKEAWDNLSHQVIRMFTGICIYFVVKEIDPEEIAKLFKMTEVQVAKCREYINNVNDTLKKVLSSWAIYMENIQLLKPWLEETRKDHLKKISPETLAAWNSRHGSLNEAGNFLIESSNAEVGSSVSGELKKLNRKWAKLIKKTKFEAFSILDTNILSKFLKAAEQLKSILSAHEKALVEERSKDVCERWEAARCEIMSYIHLKLKIEREKFNKTFSNLNKQIKKEKKLLNSGKTKGLIEEHEVPYKTGILFCFLGIFFNSTSHHVMGQNYNCGSPVSQCHKRFPLTLFPDVIVTGGGQEPILELSSCSTGKHCVKNFSDLIYCTKCGGISLSDVLFRLCLLSCRMESLKAALALVMPIENEWVLLCRSEEQLCKRDIPRFKIQASISNCIEQCNSQELKSPAGWTIDQRDRQAIGLMISEYKIQLEELSQKIQAIETVLQDFESFLASLRRIQCSMDASTSLSWSPQSMEEVSHLEKEAKSLDEKLKQLHIYLVEAESDKKIGCEEFVAALLVKEFPSISSEATQSQKTEEFSLRNNELFKNLQDIYDSISVIENFFSLILRYGWELWKVKPFLKLEVYKCLQFSFGFVPFYRREYCKSTMELLKQYQSCKTCLTSIILKQENALSQQVSYMGKENLQKIIAKVKEEFNSYSEDVDRLNQMCKNLQSQVNKMKSFEEPPFENEANAIVDRWLDINERTESYCENLERALALWDKLLDLSSLIDEWSDAVQKNLEDGNVTEKKLEELELEKFDTQVDEIQDLLNSSEPPLELQVIKSSLLNKMELIRKYLPNKSEPTELKGSTTELKGDLDLAKSQIGMTESLLEALSPSDTLEIFTKLEEIHQKILHQKQHVKLLQKETGYLNPDVIELKKLLTSITDLFNSKKQIFQDHFITLLNYQCKRFDDWFSNVQISLEECFDSSETKEMAEKKIHQLISFLNFEDKGSDIDEVKTIVNQVKNYLPKPNVHQLNNWVRDQEVELQRIISKCQARKMELHYFLQQFARLEKDFKSLQKWLRTQEEKWKQVQKEKTGLEHFYQILLKQREWFDSFDCRANYLKNSGFFNDEAVLESAQFVSKYKRLVNHVQKTLGVSEMYCVERKHFEELVRNIFCWMEILKKPVLEMSAEESEIPLEERLFKIQEIALLKVEGNAKLQTIITVGEHLKCDDKSKNLAIEQIVSDVHKKWDSTIHLVIGCLRDQEQLQHQMEHVKQTEDAINALFYEVEKQKQGLNVDILPNSQQVQSQLNNYSALLKEIEGLTLLLNELTKQRNSLEICTNSFSAESLMALQHLYKCLLCRLQVGILDLCLQLEKKKAQALSVWPEHSTVAEESQPNHQGAHSVTSSSWDRLLQELMAAKEAKQNQFNLVNLPGPYTVLLENLNKLLASLQKENSLLDKLKTEQENLSRHLSTLDRELVQSQVDQAEQWWKQMGDCLQKKQFCVAAEMDEFKLFMDKAEELQRCLQQQHDLQTGLSAPGTEEHPCPISIPLELHILKRNISLLKRNAEVQMKRMWSNPGKTALDNTINDLQSQVEELEQITPKENVQITDSHPQIYEIRKEIEDAILGNKILMHHLDERAALFPDDLLSQIKCCKAVISDAKEKEPTFIRLADEAQHVASHMPSKENSALSILSHELQTGYQFLILKSSQKLQQLEFQLGKREKLFANIEKFEAQLQKIVAASSLDIDKTNIKSEFDHMQNLLEKIPKKVQEMEALVDANCKDSSEGLNTFEQLFLNDCLKSLRSRAKRAHRVIQIKGRLAQHKMGAYQKFSEEIRALQQDLSNFHFDELELSPDELLSKNQAIKDKLNMFKERTLAIQSRLSYLDQYQEFWKWLDPKWDTSPLVELKNQFCKAKDNLDKRAKYLKNLFAEHDRHQIVLSEIEAIVSSIQKECGDLKDLTSSTPEANLILGKKLMWRVEHAKYITQEAFKLFKKNKSFSVSLKKANMQQIKSLDAKIDGLEQITCSVIVANQEICKYKQGFQSKLGHSLRTLKQIQSEFQQPVLLDLKIQMIPYEMMYCKVLKGAIEAEIHSAEDIITKEKSSTKQICLHSESLDKEIEEFQNLKIQLKADFAKYTVSSPYNLLSQCEAFLSIPLLDLPKLEESHLDFAKKQEESESAKAEVEALTSTLKKSIKSKAKLQMEKTLDDLTAKNLTIKEQSQKRNSYIQRRDSQALSLMCKENDGGLIVPIVSMLWLKWLCLFNITKEWEGKCEEQNQEWKSVSEELERETIILDSLQEELPESVQDKQQATKEELEEFLESASNYIENLDTEKLLLRLILCRLRYILSVPGSSSGKESLPIICEIQNMQQRTEDTEFLKNSPHYNTEKKIEDINKGLQAIENMLHQKSENIAKAKEVQKRIWDLIDLWHYKMNELDSEVQDIVEQNPHQAQELLDRLMIPLQRYQHVSQHAERRTTNLNRAASKLEECDELLKSIKVWLENTSRLLTEEVKSDSAKALNKHASALEMALEDSQQKQSILSAISPELKELSPLIETDNMVQELTEVNEQVKALQQKIMEILPCIQHLADDVEAIESEVKTMEKDIEKIKTILSPSEDTLDLSPKEHLKHCKVILTHICPMKKAVVEMQSYKAKLRLTDMRMQPLSVFQRTKQLLKELKVLERLTEKQNTLLEVLTKSSVPFNLTCYLALILIMSHVLMLNVDSPPPPKLYSKNNGFPLMSTCQVLENQLAVKSKEVDQLKNNLAALKDCADAAKKIGFTITNLAEMRTSIINQVDIFIFWLVCLQVAQLKSSTESALECWKTYDEVWDEIRLMLANAAYCLEHSKNPFITMKSLKKQVEDLQVYFIKTNMLNSLVLQYPFLKIRNIKEYYLQASKSGDSITLLAEPETQNLLQEKFQPLQRISYLEKMLQMKADVYQKRIGSCIIFHKFSFRLPLCDFTVKRLQNLNRQWTQKTALVLEQCSELQKDQSDDKNFLQQCQNWVQFLERMKESLKENMPATLEKLQEQQKEYEILQTEISINQQIFSCLVSKALNMLDSEEAENRTEFISRLTLLKEQWQSAMRMAHRKKIDIDSLVKQWQKFTTLLQDLTKFLMDTSSYIAAVKSQEKYRLDQIRNLNHKFKNKKILQKRWQTRYSLILETGEKLLGMVAPEAKAAMQLEMNKLRVNWDNTQFQLEKITRQFQDTIQTWENCESQVKDLGHVLLELKGSINKPLPIEHDALPATLEQVKVLEKALTNWSQNAKELDAQKVKLAQFILPEDVMVLREQTELLHSQWEELCLRVSLHKQDIEEQLNAWIVFNEKNKELCTWLMQMEEKVPQSADISIEDMIDKLQKDYMEEINLFNESQLVHFKQMGNQLIKSSNQSRGAEIEEKLNKINDRWQHLFDIIGGRVKKLKDTFAFIQQLDKNMSHLHTWLARIESELSKPIVYDICDDQEIQRRLAEQQDLQRDIEQHTAGVESVFNICEILLHDSDACANETECDSIQQTTRSLERRWRNICAMSIERRMKIEATWRLWQKFLEDYSRFEVWLKTAEKTAAYPNSSEILYVTAKEELKKFEAFQRQIHERLTQLELINKQYRRLARENRTDSANKLKQMVYEGNHRWDNLQKRVTAILRRLKHFTSQWEEFMGTKDNIILVWLTEMDLQLTNVEHFSKSDFDDKMRQLNGFQREIMLNTSKIDQLIASGLYLIQKSEPEDAIILEEELEEFYSYCQEVFGRVARFHQRLISWHPGLEDEKESSENEADSDHARGMEVDPWPKKIVPEGPPSQQSLCHLIPTAGGPERSGCETPVSVDSIPLEWDHTGDVGGSSSPEDEEEDSFFSALSGKCQPTILSINVNTWKYTNSDTIQIHKSRTIERWELLQVQDLSNKLRMKQTWQQWQQLNADLTNIDIWLDKMEEEMEGLQEEEPQPVNSIQAIDQRVKKLKDMLKAYNNYKALVLSVNLTSKDFKQTDSTGYKELQNRLRRVNLRWEKANILLENWKKNLQKALIHCQDFHEQNQKLLLWLAAAETRRHQAQVKEPNADPHRIQESRKELMQLEKELLERQLQVNNLQEIAEYLLVKPDGEKYIEANEKVHVIGKKLKQLLEGVSCDLKASQGRQDVSTFQVNGEELDSGMACPIYKLSSVCRMGEKEETNSFAPKKHAFFCRVLRAALPLQLFLLLLLFLASLIPVSEEDYSCTQTNNFARSFYPMLRYINGPPPI